MLNYKIKKFIDVSVAIVVAFFIFGLTEPSSAATPVDLGAANSFAVLGGSGITIAGTVSSTTINGDIGTFPTTSITGFGNVVLNGTNHTGDTVTQEAKTDLTAAYNTASGYTCDTDLSGQDLGGKTLTPGVYCFGSSVGLTGTLTLDAQGDPDAVFIFQIGSTLITASGSDVVLTNGAQYPNVFWQVGSSATLGTTTDFKGTIIALDSITLTTGATVQGRALARNGAVTLDNNNIDVTPRLTVTKVVINHGGDKQVSDFPLFIDGDLITSGTENLVNFGDHVVSETGDLDYTETITGNCATDGSINLIPGDNKSCTITNEEKPSKVIIHKIIINHGLSNDAAHFAPYKVGTTTVTLDAETVMDSGIYVVSETPDTDYTASFTAGDCDAGGNITLASGVTKTCTITNEEIAQPGDDGDGTATLHIIKKVENNLGSTTTTASDFNLYVKLTGSNVVGSPAAGIASPGRLYTLSAGTYVVSEDDDATYSQSFSGDCDLNGNVTLIAGNDYTCTITNTEIAQTVGDGDSNEDEDRNQGIKVIKKADPSSLSGFGIVTYTYKVSNEGDDSIKKVSVKDDKCKPMKFISGDSNHDSRLDTNETWKYTCAKEVFATETNKVIARGTAEGEKVKDTDKATVIVSPGLPNAGIDPAEAGSDSRWNVFWQKVFYFRLH